MRYAINAAPINGWQTFNRIGSSAMEIAATGDAVVADLGHGTVAMSMAVSGAALVAELRTGIVVQEMTATGDAKQAKPGMASSSMVMAGSAALKQASTAQGISAMLMELAHGIPYKPIPTGFVENKRDRKMRMPADDRRFVVAKEVQLRLRPERPLRVAGTSRRF